MTGPQKESWHCTAFSVQCSWLVLRWRFLVSCDLPEAASDCSSDSGPPVTLAWRAYSWRGLQPLPTSLILAFFHSLALVCNLLMCPSQCLAIVHILPTSLLPCSFCCYICSRSSLWQFPAPTHTLLHHQFPLCTEYSVVNTTLSAACSPLFLSS